MCSICQKKDTRVCNVYVFVAGTNDNGGRATKTIATLCDDCVKLMLTGDIVISKPDNTIRFEQLWDE